MRKTLLCVAAAVVGAFALHLMAQTREFKRVTQEMLMNPSPDDWLMFRRTYDAQRFSPLNQINRQNVGQLRLAWSWVRPRRYLRSIKVSCT